MRIGVLRKLQNPLTLSAHRDRMRRWRSHQHASAAIRTGAERAALVVWRHPTKRVARRSRAHSPPWAQNQGLLLRRARGVQRVRPRRARRTHPLPGRVAGALWRVEEESTFETNLRPRVFDLRSRGGGLRLDGAAGDRRHGVRGFSIGSGLVAHGARRNDAARLVDGMTQRRRRDG